VGRGRGGRRTWPLGGIAGCWWDRAGRAGALARGRAAGIGAAIEVKRSASLAWLMSEALAPQLESVASAPTSPTPLLIPRAALTAAALVLVLGWALMDVRLYPATTPVGPPVRLAASVAASWTRASVRQRRCRRPLRRPANAARTSLCHRPMRDLPRLRLVIAHEAEHHRRGDSAARVDRPDPACPVFSGIRAWRSGRRAHRAGRPGLRSRRARRLQASLSD